MIWNTVRKSTEFSVLNLAVHWSVWVQNFDGMKVSWREEGPPATEYRRDASSITGSITSVLMSLQVDSISKCTNYKSWINNKFQSRRQSDSCIYILYHNLINTGRHGHRLGTTATDLDEVTFKVANRINMVQDRVSPLDTVNTIISLSGIEWNNNL